MKDKLNQTKINRYDDHGDKKPDVQEYCPADFLIAYFDCSCICIPEASVTAKRKGPRNQRETELTPFISLKNIEHPSKNNKNNLIMKFIGGFIAGVVATVIVLILIYVGSESGETHPGLTLFPEKGGCIAKKELEIFQTIGPTMALAKFDEFPDETLVLLVNYENQYYYDDQRIKIPTNKCARQIGIYQYDTKMEIQKTVPVVVIE